MKKFYISAIAGVAALSLAACSESATPVEDTTDNSDLTLQDVFTKAMTQQENIKSAKATMAQDQTIEIIGNEALNISVSSNVEIDLTSEPIMFYIDGQSSMTMANETQDMPLKMYFSETDGLYMYDIMSDGWLKLPAESYKEILEQTGANANAIEQLELFKPFLDDFTFEQNDSSYILTLNAKGEKFNDLIFEQLGSTLNQTLNGDLESVMDGMNFENVQYTIKIDKETFDIMAIDADIAFEMDIEGTKAKVNALSTIDYHDFNQIDTITIPQEVIDNATEA